MTPTTTELEARELLAREYERVNRQEAADNTRKGSYGWNDSDRACAVRVIAALTREQRGGDPRKAALDELARENERLGLSYADAPQQEAPGAVAWRFKYGENDPWQFTLYEPHVPDGWRKHAAKEALYTTPPAPVDVRLREVLIVAEAALADIGDADREPGDDLAWCERRAAKALPDVRQALALLSGQQAGVES